MATYTLNPIRQVDENGFQQYKIEVTFSVEGNPVFEQDVLSNKQGVELDKQMQDYADQYETDWKAANGF